MGHIHTTHAILTVQILSMHAHITTKTVSITVMAPSIAQVHALPREEHQPMRRLIPARQITASVQKSQQHLEVLMWEVQQILLQMHSQFS